MDGDGGSTPSQDIAGENPQANSVFQSTMDVGWWRDIIGEDLEDWDHRRLLSTLPEPQPILSDADNYEEYVLRLLETVPLFAPPQETTEFAEKQFCATSPLESPFPSQETSSSPPRLNPATPPSPPPPSPTEPPYSSPLLQNHPRTPGTLPSPTQKDQDQDKRPSEARAARAARRQENIDIIEQPYPWATRRRAEIQTMQYMQSNKINLIRGKVHCKRCSREYDVEYDLRQKFTEVCKFIAKEIRVMNREAPEGWMKPVLLNCRFCGARNSAEPVIGRKRNINWLFLFLGKMLGFLKLEHLRYFLKHTHGADRFKNKPCVLYLTYMGLCKQLFPDEPFDPSVILGSLL